ncbi:MAG TPA: hypothetical protein VH572_08730 [Gaiella sp.]
MLGPGDPIPDVHVWREPAEEAVPLRAALAGDGPALLCFYPFDWSPT